MLQGSILTFLSSLYLRHTNLYTQRKIMLILTEFCTNSINVILTSLPILGVYEIRSQKPFQQYRGDGAYRWSTLVVPIHVLVSIRCRVRHFW